MAVCGLSKQIIDVRVGATSNPTWIPLGSSHRTPDVAMKTESSSSSMAKEIFEYTVKREREINSLQRNGEEGKNLSFFTLLQCLFACLE